MTPRPLLLALAPAFTACASLGGPARPRVTPPGPATCVAESGLDDPELDREITALMQEARLPGLAVCTLRDGEVDQCAAYGTREGGGGGPITADTPFLLASISKLYTATAVLQLAEDGLLDLDADLQEVLPFRLRHPDAPGRAITARMVLAHVGGIDDNYDVLDDWYVDGRDPDRALLDAVAGYLDPAGRDYDPDANFTWEDPGEGYTYSNLGYALLGAVVEAVTGEDFAAYTDRAVFAPLGLDHTSWRLDDFDRETLAVPTSWTRGAWEPHGHYTFVDYPNGGLRSSACDVARFFSAMAQGGGGLLQPATVAEAMQVAYPRLDDTQGLGWYDEDMGEREPWIGHGGAELGVSTDAFMRRSGDVGVVMLANGDWIRDAPMLDLQDALIAHVKRR